MRAPTDLHTNDTIARDRLARRLRSIREGRQISQRDLAARLSIDHKNVSGIELRRTWKVSTVQAWTRALGYRLDLRPAGLVVPDDGDPLAALYDAQQPATEADEDRLDLRIFGNDLARIRRAQEVTLAALGARLGCGESAVSRRESSPDGLLVATAQRFTRALGGVLQLDLAPVWSDKQATERTLYEVSC